MRTNLKFLVLVTTVALLLSACGVQAGNMVIGLRWPITWDNERDILGLQWPVTLETVDGTEKPTVTAPKADEQLYTLPNRNDPASISSEPQGELEIGGSVIYSETGRNDNTFLVTVTVEEGWFVGYRGSRVNGERAILGIIPGPADTSLEISDGATDLLPNAELPHYIRGLFVMHCRGFDAPTGSTKWTYKPWDVNLGRLEDTLGAKAYAYWPAGYPASCVKNAADEARFWADPEAWDGPAAEAPTEPTAAPAAAVVNPTPAPETAAEAAPTVVYDAANASTRVATGDLGRAITVAPGVPLCGTGIVAGPHTADEDCWVFESDAAIVTNGVAGLLWESDLAGRTPTVVP